MAEAQDRLARPVAAFDRLRIAITVRSPAPSRLIFDDHLRSVEIAHDLCTERLAAALNERRAVRRAVEVACGDAAFGEELAGELAQQGLLVDERLTSKLVPAATAEAFLLQRLDDWCEDIYYDGLWDPMLERRDGANLLYGWIVENYHYTRSVNEHLGSAIGNVRDLALGRRFVHHLAEEWDHPHLFLKVARALSEEGGIGQQIERSRPLGSTRALTLLLKRASKVHPFVYKTCAAVLERTANRVEETRQFYRRVAEVQGLPPSILEPVISHAETDERYEHLNSLAEFRAFYTGFAPEIVRESLDYGRRFVDLLHAWQRDIADHYRHFPFGDGARP